MENNKPKKRKKSLYRTRELHLMLFPAVIFTALFCYLPIGGLIMAFQDFKPLLGFQKSAFVGLKQFHYIFTMPSFRQAFVNTIIIAFFKITLSILVPLVLSLMLNEVTKSWFKRSVQTIVFIPYFFSWAILAGMVLEIFAYDGVINNVLESLFGMESIAFLVSNKYFRTIVIGSDVWKGMGYNTVLLLAAITNVDPTLHEAAQVDGAGRWKQMLHAGYHAHGGSSHRAWSWRHPERRFRADPDHVQPDCREDCRYSRYAGLPSRYGEPSVFRSSSHGTFQIRDLPSLCRNQLLDSL